MSANIGFAGTYEWNKRVGWKGAHLEVGQWTRCAALVTSLHGEGVNETGNGQGVREGYAMGTPS